MRKPKKVTNTLNGPQIKDTSIKKKGTVFQLVSRPKNPKKSAHAREKTHWLFAAGLVFLEKGGKIIHWVLSKT